jgi:hypothetical protein
MMRIFKNEIFTNTQGNKTLPTANYARRRRKLKMAWWTRIMAATNYGGNLYKKRIARKGEGKSGGHRTILAYVKGGKTFFMYGFEKSGRDNIEKDEERDYKKLAKRYISLNDAQLTLAKDENVLFEVNCDEKNL